MSKAKSELKPEAVRDVELESANAADDAVRGMIQLSRELAGAYAEKKAALDGPAAAFTEAETKVEKLELEIVAFQGRAVGDRPGRPEPEPLPSWVPDQATSGLYDARKQLERMITWTVKKVLEEQAGMHPRAAGQVAWRVTEGELDGILGPVLGYVKAHLEKGGRPRRHEEVEQD